MAYGNKRSSRKGQFGSYGFKTGYARMIKEFSLPATTAAATQVTGNNPYGMNAGQFNQMGQNTQQGQYYGQNQPGQQFYGGINPSQPNYNNPYNNQFGQVTSPNTPLGAANDGFAPYASDSRQNNQSGNMYGFQSVSDGKPFVAVDVYNKLLQLSLIALLFGAVTYLFPISPGILLATILTGFIVGLIGIFRPRLAKIIAPIYAATEGLVLGTLSFYFSSRGTYVVPLAIIGTAAVFVAVMTLYRTGIIHVTPKFVSVTIVSSFTLLAVMIGATFLSISSLQAGLATFIIFGVLYLFISIMNLFVDFNMIYTAETRGISADGEWYAALLLMMSLIMTFLALLRILGGVGRR